MRRATDAARDGHGASATRFEALDGLRAVAALSVVVYHAADRSSWRSADIAPGLDPRRWVGALGSYGVCVFFLLSGFLLYRPFVAAHLAGGSAVDIGSFLRRRVLRIFPAYWVVMVAVFALGLSTYDGLPTHWWLYPALTFLGQNYVRGGLFGGLAVAWSLCVEMSFYLCLPLIAAWVRRLPGGLAHDPRERVRAQLAALAVLYIGGWSWRIALSTVDTRLPGTPEGWLPSFLDWFALGMLLAVAHTWREAGGRLPAPLTFLGTHAWFSWLLAAQLYWVSVQLDIPVGFGAEVDTGQHLARFLLHGTSAALLLAPGVLSEHRSRALAVLGSRPLAFLGAISYGIYLWHYPVLQLLDRWGIGSSFPVLLGLATAGTLVVAWISYVAVERPAQALGRRPRHVQRTRAVPHAVAS
jgi:peptidoglycan/LPS O-acetylase OafA/YrhL